MAFALVLLVVFFVWSGSALGRAFKVPSGSKVLIAVALLLALLGVTLLTRWGRRKVLGPVVRAVRSSATNLRKVSKSPVKLTMLFGGSVLVTFAYICAFGGSVAAFGGSLSVPKIGAVFLEGGSSLFYFTGTRWGGSERTFGMVLPTAPAAFCATT